MSGFETPSQRFRDAIPTASLSHLQRLARKCEDIRNSDPSTRLTSLALAAQAGRIDVVEWLLDEGHDESEISRDTLGETLVHICAANGELDCLEEYLEMYPFVIDWVNSKGASPLHTACEKGQVPAVAMCVEFGCDVNARDFAGNTPLHYAMTWGKLDAALVLLDFDCQTDIKNNLGFTPADYAYSFAIAKSLQEEIKTRSKEKKKKREKSRSPAPPDSRNIHHKPPFLLQRSASDVSSFAPSIPGTPDDKFTGDLLSVGSPSLGPTQNLSPRESARLFRATSAKSASPRSPNLRTEDSDTFAPPHGRSTPAKRNRLGVDSASEEQPEHVDHSDRSAGTALPGERSASKQTGRSEPSDALKHPPDDSEGPPRASTRDADSKSDSLLLLSPDSAAVSRSSTSDSRAPTPTSSHALSLAGPSVHSQLSRLSALSTTSDPQLALRRNSADAGAAEKRKSSGSSFKFPRSFGWKRRTSLPSSSLGPAAAQLQPQPHQS